MVPPLPPVKRYISNTLDSATETSFDLVVNSLDNQYTYGGGRFAVQKPYNDAQMRTAIDDAVRGLIQNGNGPRGMPAGAQTVPESRAAVLYVESQNRADRSR